MIDVAIIEDNAQYRQTLCIILQLDESLKLVHKLNNCNNMIEVFKKIKPDVVIMDIDLPGINGIQGVWELKREWPDIKVLMLTVFEDEEKIFGAIKAGANGYMLKKDSPQKIIESVHAISKGESAMNGLIASKVLEYFYNQQRNSAADLDKTNLTQREKEVLQLLVKGFSYKEIASDCFISTQTLNSHIKNIYQKLDIHSRSELAAKFGNKFV
jgi:DNA-binding NarL/FixJ family response regulator